MNMRMRVKVRFCMRVMRVRAALGAVAVMVTPAAAPGLASVAVRMRMGAMTVPAAGLR